MTLQSTTVMAYELVPEGNVAKDKILERLSAANEKVGSITMPTTTKMIAVNKPIVFFI